MWEPRFALPESSEPKIPWELTDTDRQFLRCQRIDPEGDNTPYPGEHGLDNLTDMA